MFHIETVERFYYPITFDHGLLLDRIIKTEENKAYFMCPYG